MTTMTTTTTDYRVDGLGNLHLYRRGVRVRADVEAAIRGYGVATSPLRDTHAADDCRRRIASAIGDLAALGHTVDSARRIVDAAVAVDELPSAEEAAVEALSRLLDRLDIEPELADREAEVEVTIADSARAASALAEIEKRYPELATLAHRFGDGEEAYLLLGDCGHTVPAELLASASMSALAATEATEAAIAAQRCPLLGGSCTAIGGPAACPCVAAGELPEGSSGCAYAS